MINCYKYHGREDLLPAFTEEDEKANAAATANANVSSSVGVLKMHTSGMVPTHKIQIQANGSPQIIAASPDGMSGSSAQVCLDPAGYNSDVDVGSLCTTLYNCLSLYLSMLLLFFIVVAIFFINYVSHKFFVRFSLLYCCVFIFVWI